MPSFSMNTRPRAFQRTYYRTPEIQDGGDSSSWILSPNWLMPISCHFRDCKALLVTSLTHVSGAIASVQTFSFKCKNAIFQPLHYGLVLRARHSPSPNRKTKPRHGHGVSCGLSATAELLVILNACKSAPEASRRLRSSCALTCVIPWSRTRLGDKSFDVAGPWLWNKLPASLRSSDSLCQFRKQLKTFLFVED